MFDRLAYMREYRRTHPEFRQNEIKQKKKYSATIAGKITHSKYIHSEKRHLVEKRRAASLKRIIYQRQYYEAHKQRAIDRARRWNEDNKERFQSIQTEWYKQNRANRRFGIAIPFDLWMAVMSRSPMCPMCGRFVEVENLTADHIVPLSRGGYHHISNISPLCHSCNSRKHKRLPPVETIKQIVVAGGADPELLEEIEHERQRPEADSDLCQDQRTVGYPQAVKTGDVQRDNHPSPG